MINKILNKYLNNEKNSTFNNYSLDNITSLLIKMGNPHRNFRSVHIAGTNGKGTTAFLIARILEKSGYKTGLYISPHLLRITERININFKEIPERTLFNYLEEIDSIVQNTYINSPTYFDILTASAFKYFSDKSVDIAVIETGLGGRLDSTNVIVPELSIITDISLDHMHILGDKVESITAEKCGIIKKDKPVITSNTDGSVLDIIKGYSLNSQSELYIYNRDYHAENVRFDNELFIFDFTFREYRFLNIKLGLFPQHQLKNAATALTAVSILRSMGFTNIIEKDIYQIFEKFHMPGRFEKLCQDPLIIFDPAHNFHALTNLIKGIDEYYPENKIIYIVSLMTDKADERTLGILQMMSNEVIYYLLNDPRAYIPDKDQYSKIISDPDSIIDLLKSYFNKNVIFVFTGTFRIYETALKIAVRLGKSIKEDHSDRRDYGIEK